MTAPLRITIDTNVLSPRNAAVVDRARALGFDVVQTSVTEREVGEGNSRIRSEALGSIPETAVWDESPWDQAQWADESADDCLETVLTIIGDGAFPPRDRRDDLTTGQRRQLRDGMIFCAHIRDRRDIFVSEDLAAFAGDRRARIESQFSSRIMTPLEFLTEFVDRAV